MQVKIKLDVLSDFIISNEDSDSYSLVDVWFVTRKKDKYGEVIFEHDENSDRQSLPVEELYSVVKMFEERREKYFKNLPDDE